MSWSSQPLVASVRRLLFAVAAIASAWGFAIFLLGGFNVRLAGIRVSSQSPYRAVMIALASAAMATTLESAASDRSKHRFRGWLRPDVATAGIGVALLVAQWAAARPLWLDEEMIALNFRDRTLSGLSGRLSFDQTAPFGWLALERVVFVALGANEIALRLVPLLFGIGTVLCAVWIGRRWMSPIGSTVFVLLCSFGQWLSFYAVELKHYSADAFGGLLLPALAVWVVEADDHEIRRRLGAWTAVAAVVLWFSIGALLVMPACTVFLTLLIVRRRSALPARYLLSLACLCAASFGAHYAAALRYARESEYLQSFWDFAFPPPSAGVIARFAWIGERLDDFAVKPGGTELALLLWTSAAAGFVLTNRRLLGGIAAAVVLSGLVFAGLRLVPLFERLSLWFVPALYLGVALLADSAAAFARRSRGPRGWVAAAATACVAIVTFRVCSDVLRHGVEDVRNFRPADSNRSTDDRTAVSWLMSQRRPGDAVVTTQLGLPAVMWYGNVPSVRGPVLVAEHSASANECVTSHVRGRLKGQSRVLVYVGFRDFPHWFDDQLLLELTDGGSVTAVRHFGSMSRVAVVDLDAPQLATGGPARWNDALSEPPARLYGCVIARQAARW